MTVLVPTATAPAAPPLTVDERIWLQQILRRMAHASALRDIGHRRYNDESTINVAEAGTFDYIPAKGFTFTDTGSIFIREEVLRHLLQDTYTASRVLGGIERGETIDPGSWLPYQQDTVRETVAAFGVTGHEFGHLAGSEHTGRRAWQMVLEDLRIESMWLDADPVRARQALRACAEYWVANDASPTETGGATRVVDPDQYQTKADVLHAYLLFVGRGRIGVLATESLLVDGVRKIANIVLGYDVLVEVDEIIDRYLETARDHEDPDGIRERAELAKRMSSLVKDPPRKGGGCFHGPKDPSGDPGGESEEGEGEPGEGDPGTESGKGKDKGKDKDTDPEGEGEGEGEGDADSGSDKGEGSESEDGEQGEGSEDGEGSGSGEGDSDGEGDSGSDGDSDSDGGDEGDADGDAPGADSGKGTDSDQGGAGFDDLAAGAQVKGKVRPTGDEYKGEAAESHAEQGGHERIDSDTAKALAEALQDGLQEVASPTAEAGWASSEEGNLNFALERTSPKRIAQEVFSPRTKATRNRRIRN